MWEWQAEGSFVPLRSRGLSPPSLSEKKKRLKLSNPSPPSHPNPGLRTQVDAALRDTNPHAVGVCVKPLAGGAGGAAQGSVDASAFEALMMSKMRRGKGSKEAGGQQAAGGQQQQQPGSGGGFQRKD